MMVDLIVWGNNPDLPVAVGGLAATGDPVIFSSVLSHSGLNRADGGQNLLGKGDHQAAEQAEKPLCALGGVVGLDGHPHLDDAPAQDDHAHRLDDVEDEIGKVIYDGQGIAGGPGGGRGHGRAGQSSTQGQGEDRAEVGAPDPALAAGAAQSINGLFHVQVPPFRQ